MATSIGPADLLAAPPEVFDAIVDVLEKKARAEKAEELKARLRR